MCEGNPNCGCALLPAPYDQHCEYSRAAAADSRQWLQDVSDEIDRLEDERKMAEEARNRYQRRHLRERITRTEDSVESPAALLAGVRQYLREALIEMRAGVVHDEKERKRIAFLNGLAEKGTVMARRPGQNAKPGRA